MKLSYIVLVFIIFINIVVLLRATENDIHFNLKRNLLYRLETGETVCYAKRLGGHWALIYREPMDFLNSTQSTFSIGRYRPS